MEVFIVFFIQLRVKSSYDAEISSYLFRTYLHFCSWRSFFLSVLRRNAHLKLLTLVFFLFILEKLTESYMLFTSGVEGAAATLGPGLAVFDSIADVFLFIALIWFFHSFHRILNPARAVVLFLLYLVGWLLSFEWYQLLLFFDL